MPDGLYEHDILQWSEQQAELLRRLAAGERVNTEIDWPRVIEEVGDLGLSELRACESNLRQALIHFLKVVSFPEGPASRWRGEIVNFLAEAQSRFTPSMRQRVALEKLYRQACRQVAVMSTEDVPPRFPATCPVPVDELMSESSDVSGLETKFVV